MLLLLLDIQPGYDPLTAPPKMIYRRLRTSERRRDMTFVLTTVGTPTGLAASCLWTWKERRTAYIVFSRGVGEGGALNGTVEGEGGKKRGGVEREREKKTFSLRLYPNSTTVAGASCPIGWLRVTTGGTMVKIFTNRTCKDLYLDGGGGAEHGRSFLLLDQGHNPTSKL